MRVMILGAAGMLGHDLVANAPQGATLFPFTRAELDITATPSLSAAVADVRPDVIINAAAYTAVDQAESEAELCFRVNAEAVGELGRVAAKRGAQVIHFSTDFVFDGEAHTPYAEDAIPNPINVYGASKLAGERALEQSGARYLLIRTSWLFGVNGRSFPRTMWERANRNAPTKVVDDQFGRPTYAIDLAKASWTLISRRMTGTYHVANQGVTTWFGLAAHVFSLAQRTYLVSPCTTEEYPVAARRPLRAVLATKHPGISLRGWRDGIEDFLVAIERPTASS